MWESVSEPALENDLPQLPVDEDQAHVVAVPVCLQLQLEVFAVPVYLQLPFEVFVLLTQVVSTVTACQIKETFGPHEQKFALCPAHEQLQDE